jgi:uncharacterized protein YkwD
MAGKSILGIIVAGCLMWIGILPALCAAPVLQENTPLGTSEVAAENALAVIERVNGERTSRGLPALVAADALQEAAQVRAQEIGVSMSHTRPDGNRWYTVSEEAFAENLAAGHTGAEQVVDDWMGSEGHRKNILNKDYTKVGAAYIHTESGRYWTLLFGCEQVHPV